MKKVLFVSHVANFVKFNKPFMQWFKEQGYEVHYASMGEEEIDCDKVYKVPFARSPLSLSNISAFRELKSIMNRERYDLVHCHTPMGGVVARLAAAATNTAPVIYTAHGFHFYKGASALNMLVYKNVERWLAKKTDALVTINSEDYEAANTFTMREKGKVYLIPGVGVDFSSIQSAKIDKKRKCEEFEIMPDSYIMLMTSEFIKRKNHKTAVEAFKKANIPNSILLLCGKGQREAEIKQFTKDLDIYNRVRFLGYRKDISEIVNISDVFLFPSFQEGLPVSVMEAMAAGIPVVCSDVRGNRDLINENGGFLSSPTDVDGFADNLRLIATDNELSEKMGNYNREKAKLYTKEVAVENMAKIYNEVIARS